MSEENKPFFLHKKQKNRKAKKRTKEYVYYISLLVNKRKEQLFSVSNPFPCLNT